MVRSQALSSFFVLHILIMLKKGGENMGSVDGAGFGGGFALIIVLFILLIIIGASFCGGYGGAPGYGVAPGYGYGGCC
jgi:uncharacterized protein (TIGR01732 family)